MIHKKFRIKIQERITVCTVVECLGGEKGGGGWGGWFDAKIDIEITNLICISI